MHHRKGWLPAAVTVAGLVALLAVAAIPFANRGVFRATQLSAREVALVGRWQMTPSNGTAWPVAFLPDGTAIRFNDRGERDIVAAWNLVGNELVIRDQHHPEDPGSEMPLVRLKVLSVKKDVVELQTPDGKAAWRLVRW